MRAGLRSDSFLNVVESVLEADCNSLTKVKDIIHRAIHSSAESFRTLSDRTVFPRAKTFISASITQSPFCQDLFLLVLYSSFG